MTTEGALPEHVGVHGGGRMGAGIAHVLAVAGVAVTVVERDEDTAAAARERVASNAEKAARRDIAVPGEVTVVTDVAALADAGLVVEAVPEDVELKQRVLAEVARVAPDAALGTNTSSLSVDTLADALPDPSRLVGLHFFNPVPASDLVEVVVGARTDPGLVERAQAWVDAIGRTAVTVRDAPGFASSRLGVFLALEAIRMVEEGIASVEDVDTAMVLGYRHPVGPLRTTDIVGLDVRLAIAEHLATELGPRVAPPQLLRDKVAAGELGRKTGQGFYAW